MELRTVGGYEVVLHDPVHGESFGGCESSLEYTECYTGSGTNAQDAMEEAAIAAQDAGWDMESLALPDQSHEMAAPGMRHNVTIRVRG